MKFKIFLTGFLFIFSLLYLNNSIVFIKKNDKLMKEIKDKESIYNTLPIDAIITKSIIIPGINGRRINLDKSYNKMKSIKSFNESLLVYDEIKPNKSIDKIFDKVIISGNLSKRKVSIILDLKEENLILPIDEILKKHNINVDIILNKKTDLNNTNFKGITNIKYHYYNSFCLTYSLTFNEDCKSNNKYTIMGNLINNFFLTNTKNILKNGIILVYHFNQNNYQELNTIIKYLKNNNYIIIPTEDLIKE